MRKIASMAAAYDVAPAPHCPLGPIALASCIQIDACAPNALIQEGSADIYYNETGGVFEYLTDLDVFEHRDGYIDVPSEPGPGIDLDESHIEDRAERTVDWHDPVWRHDDGSVAEW
jgi:galactonate dehydratase